MRLGPGLSQRLFHNQPDLVDSEGFGNIVISPQSHGLDWRIHGCVRRHHDDRQVGICFPYAGPQADPIHLWHSHIRDHQIRRLMRNELERLLAVSRSDHAMPLLFQEHGQELAHRLLVVDDQYRFHYDTPAPWIACSSSGAYLSKTLKVDPPPSRLMTSIRPPRLSIDRKSTRLNSSHHSISY